MLLTLYLNTAPGTARKHTHRATQLKFFNTLPFLLCPSTIQNSEHSAESVDVAPDNISSIILSLVHSFHVLQPLSPPSSYCLLILGSQLESFPLERPPLTPRLDSPVKCLHSTSYFAFIPLVTGLLHVLTIALNNG